jgi:hypothetical protein
MPLGDDIRALRDRTLADLNAAHDYYIDTKIAWRLVETLAETGHTFTARNMVTGTATTQADLPGKVRGYLVGYLPESTFQQFIAIFENYFFDLLHLWLAAYPQSLRTKQVEFGAILDAPDKDAITRAVVSKELNELLYERPAGWFTYLESKAKLGCPTADEIERIAEAKATRDVIVHNRGVANRVYVMKAGRLARYREGERIDIPSHYHRETWELLRKVAADMSNAAIAKAR